MKIKLAVILLLIMGATLHTIPLITQGVTTLGYDTGFYRRYLIKPFESFPNTEVPGLGQDALGPRIFLDLLKLTKLPTDYILFGSYILLWALGGLTLFILMRTLMNERVAFLALIIFTLSPAQFVAYDFMLYKHAFVLPFLFLALLALEKKSLWLFPLSIIIALSHQTTTIFYVATLTLFLAFNKNRWRDVVPTLILTTSIFLALHGNFYRRFTYTPVAVFLDAQKYFWLSAPLLFFALWGIKDLVLHQPKSVLWAFALTAFAFPLAQLPFYERIFIFTDIALVVLAALGILHIKNSISLKSLGTKTLALLTLSAIFGGWFLGNFYNQLWDDYRWISPTTQQNILELKSYIPQHATVLTTVDLAPWLLGWSNYFVIAPGLLNDWHNNEAWITLWTSKSDTEKMRFFNDFPRPLFLFLEPYAQENFLPRATCVRALTGYVTEYTCHKK